MPSPVLVAIPHWRAPTWERTLHYRESIHAAGAEFLIVNGNRLPREARGLVLTGGVDVNPRLYCEKRGPGTDHPNRPRDASELALLRQALERDIPVLCICRGHQLLNVALGGSLLQHIDGDPHRARPDGQSRFHDVTVEAGTRLASIYGPNPAMRVNSRHHQAVTPERLAPGLHVSARSPDGFIEGIESRSHRWVVGVQWHPERPEMRPAADPLFAAFVAACGA
jgi:gamma-glutamyl-gamma-aminobutyrate hydrolase PuuD